VFLICPVADDSSLRILRLSPALLALLTVASLIAPAILAYQVWRHQVTDGVAIAVGSMTLFLLVVTCMAQLLRQIGRQSKQLSQLTRVDELTGLPNRRAWSAELPAAIERARRDRVALSVALLDLDHGAHRPRRPGALPGQGRRPGPHPGDGATPRLTDGRVVPQGDGVDGLVDAAGDQVPPGHVGQHPDGLVAQPDLPA
jgi:hypothetical protein